MRLGLEEEADAEELAETVDKLERQQAKQRKKDAAINKIKRLNRGNEESVLPFGEDGEETTKEATKPKTLVVRAGEDPAAGFRTMMLRKFGTCTRAWRVLDCQKQGALNKTEFSSALRVAGYGGSATVLWTALGVKNHVALKDIDPEAWELLGNFRTICVQSLKQLSKIFHEVGNASGTRLDFEGFCKKCKRMGLPREVCPFDVLFDIFDVKCVGSITYEEVKFLDEDYKWKRGVATAVRKAGTALGGTRNVDQAMRTTGVGHLGLSMKPRRVFLPKSNSLPDINPLLRANWNERHPQVETKYSSTDDMLHAMKYVKVEDNIRIARRCQKQILKVPTEQWLDDHMHEHGGDDDRAGSEMSWGGSQH
jgi:hypothetical protein